MAIISLITCVVSLKIYSPYCQQWGWKGQEHCEEGNRLFLSVGEDLHWSLQDAHNFKLNYSQANLLKK